jgi:hypothetical protein
MRVEFGYELLNIKIYLAPIFDADEVLVGATNHEK